MEKISGLVLDFFDDADGAVIKSVFPDYQAVPDVIKTAAVLSNEERAKLPDDLYALILQNQDTTLRKFACVDAGNTCLSIEYFMKTGSKLPVEAQKTAAANLLTACEWYDIEPPVALQKIAGGEECLR